jgi:hypothetical protein
MGNYDEAVGFKLPVCGCHIDDPVQKRYSDHALKWTIDHTTAQSREFLRSLPEHLSVSSSLRPRRCSAPVRYTSCPNHRLFILTGAAGKQISGSANDDQAPGRFKYA